MNNLSRDYLYRNVSFPLACLLCSSHGTLRRYYTICIHNIHVRLYVWTSFYVRTAHVLLISLAYYGIYAGTYNNAKNSMVLLYAVYVCIQSG